MTLRTFLKRNCLPFYCILYGKRRDTWKKSRYCCSILIGALCAWLICKCIFASLIIPNQLENTILVPLIIFVAIGYTITDAIKCIILTIFISMMGKSGRSFFRALSFAFIISGPISNLSTNLGEIVRAYSCSKVLAINLTRTRFDLMTMPFRKTLVRMKDDIKEVQNTFNELKSVTKDLHEEVMGDDLYVNDLDEEDMSNLNISILKRDNPSYNADFVENRYKNKFRKRCFLQLDNGKARCKKAFVKALENCYEKMPFIIRTLICWPFKVDFICKINIFGNPEKICDPSDAIPKNFGETYVELVGTENQLSEDSSNIKVNYTILRPDEMPELKSTEETAKAVAREFKTRKDSFSVILKILQQFLAIMMLKVIYASCKYHKLYKRNLDYDNVYITDYFRHVDQNRKSLGKQPLLPLKKFETKNLIDVQSSWRRSKEEAQALMFYLLQFFFEILSGCFFLFLDYIIVSVLLIIRNNSEMSFIQEGEHTIRFHIQGSGLIARLLRNTMGNFNMHETVYTHLSNEACLPRPTKLPNIFYMKLIALYMLVIFLIYESSVFLRLRRSICGYFYRKHEKKRILYLYNCLLKRRRTVREAMMRDAKYNAMNRKIRLKANLFLKLRLKWPQYFNWLVKFKVGRRKCVICGEFEDSKFTVCKNTKCGVSYCGDCWTEMDNFCLVCNEIISVDIILNFNDFFEEFSFA